MNGNLIGVFNFFMNENILAVIIAYLVGAIPFGLLIAKYLGGVDIKKEGSGSIGATNVLRVLKAHNPQKAKKLAILTVICDALKGLLPIIIASLMNLSPNTQWSMAVFAVIGHCFSPYLKFEGGKGVATAAGVLIFFIPLEIAIAILAWFIGGKVVKISSLASFIGLFTLIIASFIIHPQISGINTHAPIIIIAFIIIYKHIPNIKRLLSGEERRVL